MRNKLGTTLWGILLVLAGIGFAGNALGFWRFELFFDGWWTLFIIVPCIISIIQNGFNAANTIGIVVGVLLFLSAQNIINRGLMGKLMFPIILVAIGLSILFRGKFRNNTDPNIIEVENLNSKGPLDYTAIFGGQDIRIDGEKFSGATVTCIFGGVELNLRDAIIDRDVEIVVTAIFGGAEIFMPPNVKVKAITTPIFGGVSNRALSSTDENAHTVYVNCTCIFGGLEIK